MTFLVFTFISFSFWVFLSIYEINDATYRIRFRVENQPSSSVFTTFVPSELQLTLRDKNLQLLRYGYDSRLDNLTVDFGRYADASGNFRISAAELASLVQEHLQTSTQIVTIQPTLIDARHAVTDGRMFAVRPWLDVTTAANYRMHSISTKPDSVLVHAPAAILDTLRFVSTQLLRAYDLTDTLRRNTGFVLPIGTKVLPAEVEVVVPVAKYVEKTFRDIPIRVTDVPAGHRLEIFPNKGGFSCLIDFTIYRKLQAKHIELTVSYDSIRNIHQRKLPVDIFVSSTDNEELSSLKFWPDSVEFIDERMIVHSE